MKQTFTKEEIREVVQETVRDYFRNFSRSLMDKPKKVTEDDLFTDLELWIETFIDHRGKYKGPSIYVWDLDKEEQPFISSSFTNGVFIRDLDMEIVPSDLEFLKRWNKGFAQKYGLSTQQVLKANKEAYNSWFNRYDPLGSFPT